MRSRSLDYNMRSIIKPDQKQCTKCSQIFNKKDFGSHRTYCRKCYSAYRKNLRHLSGETKQPRREVPAGKKYCPACGKIKNISAFSTGAGYCRPCLSKRQKKYREDKLAEPLSDNAEKMCSRCGESLPIGEFDSIVESYCRACRNAYARERRNTKRTGNKKCSKCREIKDITEFGSPIDAYCKPCRRQYARDRRLGRKKSEEN